ncbi:MAG: HDOD domain-containing protein [Proteobacteria bacterium]|nr:HDOD domain-containing protein [Pseudomonadota bacterium]
MSSERGQRFLKELPELNQNLPCAPTVLARLFAQTIPLSKNSTEEIAETIAHDQGLTARVLILTNSAHYGLKDSITTIPRAVSLLGLDEVRSMVLMVAALGVATSLKGRKDFELGPYWRHQILTGIAAETLAKALTISNSDPGIPQTIDPGECYTIGILHDIGKALTAIHRPDCWQSILHLAQSRGLSHSEAEIRYWGLDHGQIGAAALSAWNLPAALTKPLMWHHAPQDAPADHRLGAQLLHAADALAILTDNPLASIPGPWPEFLESWTIDREQTLADIATLAQEPRASTLISQLYD